ncbi:MAG TPA: trypsin-like peptidase domain-containing protein [Spirochaetota bacterium]|nr:trypsin-like peptidase domain-containing protein [Spirochaetota bacterium]
MIRKIYMLLFCSLLVVLFCNGMTCTSDGVSTFSGQRKSPMRDTSLTSEAWGIQKNFRGIYDLYKDRVVSISTERIVTSYPDYSSPQEQRKQAGQGTGFILSDDGYVCTNHHVVQNVDKVVVKLDGRSYVADVVGSDERTDIALLKIQGTGSFQPVFLGDSDEVRAGDIVIAIGNPFGLDKTFTMGVVSAAARRDVDFMGSSQSHIQTDASINPGNSGGPLININGEVIGINRMIYSKSGGSMGIGFAIPINTAKLVVSHLKKYKKVKRGFLGVQIAPITEELAQRLNRADAKGALVVEVMPGSPAQSGGMRRGDIIVRIGNAEINRFGDVIDIVGKTRIGANLRVVVWREGQVVTLSVRITERQ